MSVNTLMDEKQPVVLETRRFDFRENQELLHILAISVHKVSDVETFLKTLLLNDALQLRNF